MVLFGFSPPMLVFVQSRERAKELFQELIYDGLNVDIIHSERTQAQRDNIVSCFRAGKVSKAAAGGLWHIGLLVDYGTLDYWCIIVVV